jgi:superfamily II DNA or RNA helicase
MVIGWMTCHQGAMPVRVHFDRGTLVVTEATGGEGIVARHLAWDDRTGSWRGRGSAYRELILELHRAKVAFEDRARAFEELELTLRTSIAPFPYQTEALERWSKAGRGVVELPTGAGKTILAVLAIEKIRRPALVVVPTIDLMTQWHLVLEQHFGIQIGMLGGGVKEKRPITVTTYDSAAMQVEFLGAEFGFLICDECHHLPAPVYRFIAEASIAPYRLGLTATLDERPADDLLGPVVHRVGIDELEGSYLSPYEVRTIHVRLDPEEETAYEEARALYVAFLKKHRIDFGQPHGWGTFVMRSQQSAEGRAAFSAYRHQRKIALTSRAKLEELWRILVEHREDRSIVFTEDNETVYELARRLLAPAITHQTKPKERRRILDAFSAGELRVLLTSRVLNEGVDVPDANVGVILSGSGSVREHVQRLGRILRKRPDKRALLYEVLTDVAAESGISQRRRQHRAYQRSS